MATPWLRSALVFGFLRSGLYLIRQIGLKWLLASIRKKGPSLLEDEGLFCISISIVSHRLGFNSRSDQTNILYFWIQTEATLSCILSDYNKNMWSLSVIEFGKFGVDFLFSPFSLILVIWKEKRKKWWDFEMLTPFELTSSTAWTLLFHFFLR